MFASTNKVKDSDKENNVYNGYVITFDSADSWSFDNDTARNVTIFVIFGVLNDSSSHAKNRKNNFFSAR